MGLVEEVVCVFIGGKSLLCLLWGECVGFVGKMKGLLGGVLIGGVFEVVEMGFGGVEVVRVVIIEGVEYEMGVNVWWVYMGGNKELMGFGWLCVVGKVERIVMGLVWCDMVVVVVGVKEVVIGCGRSVGGEVVGGLDLVVKCMWLRVERSEKVMLGVLVFGEIVEWLGYGWF